MLKISQEIGSIDTEMVALDCIASAHKKLEKYSQTIEYYQKALPIAREIRDWKREIGILINLGFAYLKLKNYIKALLTWLSISFKHRFALPIILGIFILLIIVGFFYLVIYALAILVTRKLGLKPRPFRATF